MNDLTKTIDGLIETNKTTGDVLGKILEALAVQTTTIIALQSQIKTLNSRISELEKKRRPLFR